MNTTLVSEPKSDFVTLACDYIDICIKELPNICLETINLRPDIVADMPQYVDFNLLTKCVLNTKMYPQLNAIIQDTLFKFDVVNIRTSDGDIILFPAACFSATYSSEETVKIILNAGADVNTKDNFGQSVLSLIVPGYGVVSTKNTVQLLLDAGANINDTNKYGMTALYRSINYYSRNGIPPDFVELVTILLTNGADPNIHCTNNIYPLHCATEIGKVDIANTIIKLLINHGADVNALDNYELNALSYMVTRYLMSYEFYSETNTLQQTMEDIVAFLIDKGSNTNVRTSYSTIPLLHISIGLSINTDNFVIRKLLENSTTDVNLLSTGSKNTALHFAASKGAINIIKLLLERGAYPNIQNSYGRTPLHCAANLSNNEDICEIIDLLLSHDADFNTRDNKGNLFIYYLNDPVNKEKYSNKKIEEITNRIITTVDECDICCDDNIVVIVCNHNHKICKECLIKVAKFRCELCLLDY
jgi:ankyrin repeat protein